MTQTFKASLVVVAYGRPALTEALLDSIAEHTPEPHEVVVVDNASPDDAAKRVSQHPTHPRVIQAPSNLGYGGGVNLGVRKANSPSIVIMNSDLQVTPNWLTPLLVPVESNRATIAAPVYTDEQGNITESGASVTADGHVHTSQTPVSGVKPVDHVSAACWAIQRQSFESFGGFDSAYGLGYYEDLDLVNVCRSEKRAVVVVNESRVIHRTGGSFQPREARRLSHRNHARSQTRWSWLYRGTSHAAWDGEAAITHGRVAINGDHPDLVNGLQKHNISAVTLENIDQLRHRHNRDDVIVVQSAHAEVNRLAPRAEVTTPDGLPDALKRAGIHVTTTPPPPRFSKITATRSRRW